MKTTTNGYYKLALGHEVILDTEGKESKGKELFQWLHFSMNTWYNLKETTGKDLIDFVPILNSGNDNEIAVVLAELIHAAAKAYDQEEGNDITYNIYKVRGWFGDEIKEKEMAEITKALLWNTETGVTPTGKQTVEK